MYTTEAVVSCQFFAVDSEAVADLLILDKYIWTGRNGRNIPANYLLGKRKSDDVRCFLPLRLRKCGSVSVQLDPRRRIGLDLRLREPHGASKLLDDPEHLIRIRRRSREPNLEPGVPITRTDRSVERLGVPFAPERRVEIEEIAEVTKRRPLRGERRPPLREDVRLLGCEAPGVNPRRICKPLLHLSHDRVEGTDHLIHVPHPKGGLQGHRPEHGVDAVRMRDGVSHAARRVVVHEGQSALTIIERLFLRRDELMRREIPPPRRCHALGDADQLHERVHRRLIPTEDRRADLHLPERPLVLERRSNRRELATDVREQRRGEWEVLPPAILQHLPEQQLELEGDLASMILRLLATEIPLEGRDEAILHGCTTVHHALQRVCERLVLPTIKDSFETSEGLLFPHRSRKTKMPPSGGICQVSISYLFRMTQSTRPLASKVKEIKC